MDEKDKSINIDLTDDTTLPKPKFNLYNIKDTDLNENTYMVIDPISDDPYRTGKMGNIIW